MSKEDKKCKVVPFQKKGECPVADPSNPQDDIWKNSDSLEAAIQARLAPLMQENEKLHEKLNTMRSVVDIMQRESTTIEIFFGALHDINNLLTFINGYTTLLIKEQEQRDAPEQIIKAAERCGDIIANLYTLFSGSGPEKSILNATEVCENIIKLIPKTIRINTKIILDPLSTKGASVCINSTHFCQIMLNLIKNACEACNNGNVGVHGLVQIKISILNFESGYSHFLLQDSKLTGPTVMIQIKDNGCGIDDDTRKRLFDSFFTTKEETEKTKKRGIGLATTKRLISENGGLIRVISTAKEGACFYVFFPAV